MLESKEEYLTELFLLEGIWIIKPRQAEIWCTWKGITKDMFCRAKGTGAG